MMPAFLFDMIIFGPVKSRKLGVSPGFNLLPATKKLCNFNCIYCECGWTNDEVDTWLRSIELIKTCASG